MQVLLVNPDSPFLIDSAAFPPLGLLYLGAALEANDIDVRVVDLGIQQGVVREQLWGHRPTLIGVSVLTDCLPQIPQIIAACRDLYPDVPIAVGGPHISMHPEDLLGANAAGLGDCEEAILGMLGGPDQGGRYCSPNWTVDVNRYPIPARYLLPLHKYRYEIGGLRATSMMTQRGCPYACTFCAHWTGYQTVRTRDIANCMEEIRRLKGMGFGAVQFFDDEFNLDRGRVTEFCRALRGEPIQWRAFIRVNLFGGEQAEEMAGAGCYELCAGVESGSNYILRGVNKGATVEQATRARELCRSLGIRFKAFMILGLPGEAIETAELTRRWLLDNRPDNFDLTVYRDWDDPDGGAYKGGPGEYSGPWGELRDSIDAEVRRELGL